MLAMLGITIGTAFFFGVIYPMMPEDNKDFFDYAHDAIWWDKRND
jgi:hypothetical protein